MACIGWRRVVGCDGGVRVVLWTLWPKAQAPGWRGKKPKPPDALDDLSPGYAAHGLTGDGSASVASSRAGLCFALHQPSRIDLLHQLSFLSSFKKKGYQRMKENILFLLMTDPGQLTLRQLLQQREAARIEIQKLTQELDALKAKMVARAPEKSASMGKSEQLAYAGNLLIGIGDLCKQIGVSRTTIYRWINEGTFPSPVRMGPGAVRWRSEDVERWRTSLSSTGV